MKYKILFKSGNCIDFSGEENLIKWFEKRLHENSGKTGVIYLGAQDNTGDNIFILDKEQVEGIFRVE